MKHTPLLLCLMLLITSCVTSDNIRGMLPDTFILIDKPESKPKPTPKTPIKLKTTKFNLFIGDTSKLNQQAKTLGTICRSNTYNLKLGDNLTEALTAIDVTRRLNDTGNPDISLIDVEAKSFVNCTLNSMAQGQCQASITTRGKFIFKHRKAEPFEIKAGGLETTDDCSKAINALTQASQHTITQITKKISSFQK